MVYASLLSAAHGLPSSESSSPLSRCPFAQLKCLWEKWAGFTWRTALMLFSWWAATQGTALQIHCLFICAGPSLLLSLIPSSCLVHTPSQPISVRKENDFKLNTNEITSFMSYIGILSDIMWTLGLLGSYHFIWAVEDAFQPGIRRGHGLYRAPSEQSQSSHVNFSRSRKISAMFQLWRWTENTITGTLLHGENVHTDLIAAHVPVCSDQRGQSQRCFRLSNKRLVWLMHSFNIQ